MKEVENFINKQYPVDTGAISFSVNNSTSHQYRVVATLDGIIDVDILQKATDATIKRYPMYNVAYSKGKGCVNTVTVVDRKILVQPYNIHFEKIILKDDSPKIKVLYKTNAIAVELYHTLTDANGCLSFLNTLIACYYRMQGKTINEEGVIPYDSPVGADDFTDGYETFAKKGKTTLDTVALKKPFTVKGDRLNPDTEGYFTRMTFKNADMQLIKEKYGLTIHEFLVATLYKTYLQFKARANSNRAIRIQMPISLRSRFKTTTLRNFVGSIQFSTSETSFDKIAAEFKKFIKQATSEDELTAFLYKGHTLIKKVLPLLPAPIGRFSVNIGDSVVGEKSYSTNLSNIGLIRNKLPGIIGYDFLISPPHFAPFCVSSCAYGNDCRVLFSNGIKNDEFENEFISQLQTLGLSPTRVEKLA